ncbi:MAG TPA: hypothetical protein VGG64_26450 [Pirellulales bacterium]|jgi:hypothetical protein
MLKVGDTFQWNCPDPEGNDNVEFQLTAIEADTIVVRRLIGGRMMALPRGALDYFSLPAAQRTKLNDELWARFIGQSKASPAQS